MVICIEPNCSRCIKERWKYNSEHEIPIVIWEEVCSEANQVTCSNTWREFKGKNITSFFLSSAYKSQNKPFNFKQLLEELQSTGAKLYAYILVMPKTKKLLDGFIPSRFYIMGTTPEGIEGKSQKYLLQILFTAVVKFVTLK